MIIIKRQLPAWILWTLLLSFEASIGLPLISLFIFFKDFDNWNLEDTKDSLKIYFGLVYIAFLVAIFYNLSFAWTAVFCFVYYFLRSFFGISFFKRDRFLWQVLQLFLYLLLIVYVFFAANLEFNLFFLLQLAITALIAIWRRKIKLR